MIGYAKFILLGLLVVLLLAAIGYAFFYSQRKYSRLNHGKSKSMEVHMTETATAREDPPKTDSSGSIKPMNQDPLSQTHKKIETGASLKKSGIALEETNKIKSIQHSPRRMDLEKTPKNRKEDIPIFLPDFEAGIISNPPDETNAKPKVETSVLIDIEQSQVLTSIKSPHLKEKNTSDPKNLATKRPPRPNYKLSKTATKV